MAGAATSLLPQSGSSRLILQERHPQNTRELLLVAPVTLCQGASAAQIFPQCLSLNVEVRAFASE